MVILIGAIVVAERGAPARRPRQIVFTDVNILLHININIIAIIVVARLGAFGHGPPPLVKLFCCHQYRNISLEAGGGYHQYHNVSLRRRVSCGVRSLRTAMVNLFSLILISI